MSLSSTTLYSLCRVAAPGPENVRVNRRNVFFPISPRSILSCMSLKSRAKCPSRRNVFSYFSGKSTFQQSDDSSEPHMNLPRSSDMSRQRTIESMIVVEKVMTKFYGVDQIKKYVPTIVNVVRERKYTVNSA